MSFCRRVAAFSSVIIFIAIMSAATPAQNAPATQTTANASEPQFNPRMYQDMRGAASVHSAEGVRSPTTGFQASQMFFTSA